jgi:excisionase family DNA binding protein
MGKEPQVPQVSNSQTPGNGANQGESRSQEINCGVPGGFTGRTQPSFEQVLSSEEAAALLNIHPKTLQRLARIGEIPGFRIGKLWGFRASALNRWLDNRSTF